MAPLGRLGFSGPVRPQWSWSASGPATQPPYGGGRPYFRPGFAGQPRPGGGGQRNWGIPSTGGRPNFRWGGWGSGTPGDTAPPSTGTVGGGNAPRPVQPYYDAAAQAAVGQNTFNVNQKIGGLTLADTNAQTNAQAQIDQLNYQRPIDALKLMQGAQRSGAIDSSVYNELQAPQLQRAYDQNTSNIQRSLAQTISGNQAQIAGLQQGIPIFNQGQSNAAILRTINQYVKSGVGGEPTKIGGRGAQALTRALTGIGATREGLAAFGLSPKVLAAIGLTPRQLSRVMGGK